MVLIVNQDLHLMLFRLSQQSQGIPAIDASFFPDLMCYHLNLKFPLLSRVLGTDFPACSSVLENGGAIGPSWNAESQISENSFT